MLWILGGAAAFGLFVLYDVNSVVWKKKAIRSFFTLGSILLLITTGICLLFQFGHSRISRNSAALVYLIPGAASLALMVYSLFFALPFSETYVRVSEKGVVCDQGMYALCRHPGVLWFCLTYLFLALAWGTVTVWAMGIIYCLMNVGYVVLQDRWTFPRTFEDYEGYRKRVPFLIPTAGSMKRAWETRR